MNSNAARNVVGVCGTGQIGAPLAVAFRRAGHRVFMWVRSPHKVGGVRRVVDDLDAWLQTNVGPPSSADGALEIVADLQVIDNEAGLIIDCIAEKMDEKADLFRRFPSARDRQALFWTTTSGLSITELARQSGVGAQLVGSHFWNPPHLMPLVEVIRGEQTSEAALNHSVELVRSLGKIPVRVNRDVPGFIGNRLLHALWREAISLVQRGVASAEDVDLVARLTFGLRMPAVGPLENMDLVGLDLVQAIHSYLLADLADEHAPLPLLQEHVAGGELGMKSGEGFYDWRVRDPQQLIECRDWQIVRQLQILKESRAL